MPLLQGPVVFIGAVEPDCDAGVIGYVRGRAHVDAHLKWGNTYAYVFIYLLGNETFWNLAKPKQGFLPPQKIIFRTKNDCYKYKCINTGLMTTGYELDALALKK